MKWISIGIILLVGGAGAFWYIFSAPQAIDDREQGAILQTYSVYERTVGEQQEAISKPGSGSNIHRANLHRLLAQMLTGEMSDSDRLALANQAKIQAEKVRQDIDKGTNTHTAVGRAMQGIEEVSILSREYTKKQQELVTLMGQKQVTAESIITTLYAINDQTEEIIQRIINEEGTLTPEHIQYINAETSDAETRYDQLTRLYSEYESLGEEIKTIYRALTIGEK